MSGDRGSSRRGEAALWITAWSLQGAGLLLVSRLEIEDATVRFCVQGLVAALPLAGLWMLLRRRGGGSSQ